MSASAAIQREGVILPFDGLRVIAHELRQPLSNIESIAYYLSLVVPREDTKVQDQLARLQQLVEQSNWIVSCGLQLTYPATPAPEPVDLEELITEAMFASRPPGRPGIKLELAGDMPLVQFDPGQGRSLLEALLILLSQVAIPAHPIVVATSANPEGGVCLEMSCSATGWQSEASLGPGAALASQYCRRTVAAHGGTFDMSVDSATGIAVRIVLA